MFLVVKPLISFLGKEFLGVGVKATLQANVIVLIGAAIMVNNQAPIVEQLNEPDRL